MKRDLFSAPPMDKTERFVLGVLWAVFFALVLCFVCTTAGCQSAAQRAAMQAAQDKKIAIEARAEDEAATVEADAKVADARATVSPAAHPITSANQAVKEGRSVFTILWIAATVLLFASIGLAFTPLSVVSKIAVPVCGAVAVLSFVNVIALPFLPWVVVAGGAVLIGLGIYEVIRHKSVSGAVTAVEKEFGFNVSTTSSPTASIMGTFSSEVGKIISEAESFLPKAGTPAAPIAVTPAMKPAP